LWRAHPVRPGRLDLGQRRVCRGRALGHRFQERGRFSQDIDRSFRLGQFGLQRFVLGLQLCELLLLSGFELVVTGIAIQPIRSRGQATIFSVHEPLIDRSGIDPDSPSQLGFEPISIHLSYSSRISSFWAVVKCPRLEERDGTSKDITDFSPRQYCQITVTRLPDTEGAHSGLGTAPLSRGGLQVLTNLMTPPIIAARSAAAGIVSSHTPNIGRK